jgi:hypothetical protein
MSSETVRLTREELYKLVWSKPMTDIAAEFGMSSVAFAQYCKELHIPRPGRGYWQQIACGQKSARDRLPKVTNATPEAVVIAKYERPGLGRRPPRELAKIEVPERIGRYHPTVKKLDETLHSDRRHDGVVTIRGV